MGDKGEVPDGQVWPDLVALDDVWPAFGWVKVFLPVAHPEVRADEGLEAVDVRCVAELGEKWWRFCLEGRVFLRGLDRGCHVLTLRLRVWTGHG